MSGNQFPLKTNYELVKILGMYNGTNEIEMKNDEAKAFRYKYKYKLKKVKNIVDISKTNELMDPPPHNFTILKGYTNAVISREFAEFVLTNERVKDLVHWAKDMLIADEM